MTETHQLYYVVPLKYKVIRRMMGKEQTLPKQNRVMFMGSYRAQPIIADCHTTNIGDVYIAPYPSNRTIKTKRNRIVSPHLLGIKEINICATIAARILSTKRSTTGTAKIISTIYDYDELSWDGYPGRMNYRTTQGVFQIIKETLENYKKDYPRRRTCPIRMTKLAMKDWKGKKKVMSTILLELDPNIHNTTKFRIPHLPPKKTLQNLYVRQEEFQTVPLHTSEEMLYHSKRLYPLPHAGHTTNHIRPHLRK